LAADLAGREDVRVVIIRGEGEKAFSAGADIGDFESRRSAGETARAYDDLVEDTCRAIEAIPQPTLALVVGACMGMDSDSLTWYQRPLIAGELLCTG
jgi:enoyl-CoA hydratase/carnithine racemase